MNKFEQEIEDRCVTCWCEFYPNDPRKTIQGLIDWEVGVNEYFKPTFALIADHIVPEDKVEEFLEIYFSSSDTPDWAIAIKPGTVLKFKDYSLA